MLVGVPKLSLLHERMKLDLIQYRRYAGIIDQPLQVVLIEVGNADRACFASSLRFDQGAPGFHIVVLARCRPVDEQ
ncbi:hypothetical protein D3C79_972160 [compost metagenome]